MTAPSQGLDSPATQGMVSALSSPSSRRQRGVTLIGLLFWSVLIGSVALVGMKVFPTLNEYYTILRAVNKLAQEQEGAQIPEVRAAFERTKDIEYSISSISGKDLQITKDGNGKMVIAFAYDKEIELVAPVYLLIKYEGKSK